MFKLAAALTLLMASATLTFAADEFADQLCNRAGAAQPTPDQTLCQGDGQCVISSRDGNYYCGYKGATCPDPNGTLYTSPFAACDYGYCQDGKCAGALDDACETGRQDAWGCMGWLYCSQVTGTCGGPGASCANDAGCTAGETCINIAPETNVGSCTTNTLATEPAPAGPSGRNRRMARRHDTWA